MVHTPPTSSLLAPHTNGFASHHPFAISTPKTPEVVSGGMDRSWFMHSLRRRWLMALLMGLLVGGMTAGFLYWLFPESSSAVALFHVKPEEPFVIDSSRARTSHYDTFKATQIAAFKNNYLLSQALADPKVRNLSCLAGVEEKDKVQWLSDRLNVSFPGNSEYLQVMFSGPEPSAEQRDLVDAVCNAYISEEVNRQLQQRKSNLEILGRAHGRLTEQYQGELERYMALAKEMQVPAAETMDSKSKLLMSEILELTKQKTEIAKQLAAIQANFAVTQQMFKNPAIIEAQIDAAMQQDPKVAMLQQEINTLDYWIIKLQSTTKLGNSAAIKTYQRQKEGLEQQVAQYRAEMKQSMMNQHKSAPNPQLQAAITEFQTRAQLLQMQNAEIDGELEKKKEELYLRNEKSVDLMVKESELALLQQVLTDIQRRREASTVEQAAEGRITPLQPAISTEDINAFQRYSIATVGGLVGLALTCLGIGYMEFRNRRLNGPQQVDEGLGIRVIGTLPSLSSKRNLSQSSPVVAQLMESIDSVRTALMHDSTSKRRQMVLVTSASTLEGRTTVASQLAASLARAGRRTLLIDGDLRHPALHALFDVPLEDGLCEVLRAEVDVSDVVRATHAEGLWLLTAGYCDSDAVRALATDQIQPIFDKLRADYDFIIIDGAPVLGMPDSLLFGQYCDGAILSVLRDQSSVPKVYQASELLKSVNVRLLGAVVNGVSEKADNRIMQLQAANPKSERKQLESAEA